MPLQQPGSNAIRHVRKTVTFTGAASAGQAATNVSVFDITGRVFIHRFEIFCTTSLTEGGATAQVSFGTGNISTKFVGATDSVNIDVNEWWVDTSPTVDAETLTGGMLNQVVSVNIILRNTTQDTDGGVLVIDAYYEPSTDDGALVAA